MSKLKDENISFPAYRGSNRSLLNPSRAFCDSSKADQVDDAQQGSTANCLGNEDGKNENWFEEANSNVALRSVTSARFEGKMYIWCLIKVVNVFLDESPFFLGDLASLPVASNISPVPEDSILSYMRGNINQDENNELRDIIDDLTIEIKELKRKLRRYKKNDIRPMHVDKVMEVRTHGLSTSKKRQLEDILKEFTADESFEIYHPSKTPMAVVEKLEQVFMALEDLAKSETGFSTGSNNVEGQSPERVTEITEDLCGGPLTDSEQRYKNDDDFLNAQHTLDLHRAVASNDRPFDEDGWAKLDLLMNMARLSAINLTPGYVQYSVKRFSKQLVLSSDGRRIKRKTDVANAVRLPASYPSTSTSTSEEMLPLGIRGPRKVSRVELNESLSYKPVVFTETGSDDDDESIGPESDVSELMLDSEEMTSGLDSCSAGKKNVSPRSLPISFYKDAAFCVDLSCDGLNLNELDDYSQPESMATRRGQNKRASRFDKFLSLSKELAQSDPSGKIDENTSDRSLSVLGTYSPPSTSFDEGEPSPFELEASGTGGVVPADNFTIYVRVKHVRTAGTVESPATTGSIRFGHKINPSKKCEQNVVSVRHEQLAPSPLPPATFSFFSSSSSADKQESSTSE